MTETKSGVWFSIHIEEEEFVAFITADALQARFQKDAQPADKLASTYQKNRQVIDALAKRKFLGGALRPVQVTASDFMQ
jgi:hypothetical protein